MVKVNLIWIQQEKNYMNSPGRKKSFDKALYDVADAKAKECMIVTHCLNQKLRKHTTGTYLKVKSFSM